MAISLICFTSNGGSPIFKKKKGDCNDLSFSVWASLHGSYLFCSSQEAQLESTYTNDWTFIWKEYQNTVTILAAARNISTECLTTLLDLIYNSLLLFIDLNDFKSSNCLVHIRSKMKQFMPVIDNLLDICNSSITDLNECTLIAENSQILTKLYEFSSLIGSLFCAAVFNQKLIAGTEGWWDLNVIDRKLLISLLNSSANLNIDIPFYLTQRNNEIAYRFLAVEISESFVVCTICGLTPPYSRIDKIAHDLWKNDENLVKNAELSILKILPSATNIESSILGILLVEKYPKKYSLLLNNQYLTTERCTSKSNVSDILRLFYYRCTSVYNFVDDSNDNEAMETYWCSEYHKCYYLCNNRQYSICISYDSSVSSFFMRNISHAILEFILNNKS